MGALAHLRGPVGVICGLSSEAEAIRRAWRTVDGPPKLNLAVSGANADRAGDAASRLRDEGAEMLMSVGLCGGLDPDLPIGRVVIPAAVRVGGGNEVFASHPLAGFGPRNGTVLGVARPMTSVAQKAAAFEDTSAVAVDMESHAVARVAAEAHLPFIVLRVIVDDAHTALPTFVDGATAPSGRPRIGHLFASVASQPTELLALLRLAKASSHALASLRGATVRLVQALSEAAA